MEGTSMSKKLRQEFLKNHSSNIMVDFGCQARHLFRTMDNLFFTPKSIPKAVDILHQSIYHKHKNQEVAKSKLQWTSFCRLLNKHGLFALLDSRREYTKPLYNSGEEVLILPQADVSPKSLSLVLEVSVGRKLSDFKSMSIRDKSIPKSTAKDNAQLVDFGPEALLVFKAMQNWNLKRGRIYLAAIISYLDSTGQKRLKKGEMVRSKAWWSAFCQLLSSYGFFSWDSSDNPGNVGNTSKARSKELFMSSVTLSDKAKNWVKKGDKALKLKLTPEFVQRVSSEACMPRKFSASTPHPSTDNVHQTNGCKDVLTGKKTSQAYVKIPEPTSAPIQFKKIDFGKEARALFSGIDLLHDGASVSLSSKAREWYSGGEEVLLVQPTKEMSAIIKAEAGKREAAALADARKLVEVDPSLQKRLDDLKAKLVASIGTKGSSTGCTLNETIVQYEMDWSEPLSKYKETFKCNSWIDLLRLLPGDIRIQQTSDPGGLRLYPAITSSNCHAFEMIDKTFIALGGEDFPREPKKAAKKKRNRQQ
uniref:Uncharacterized protein n=1 Tax=Ditylenchus dipsaci TaxID=166011 RepID=A0A915DDG3_9BILA